MTQMSRLLWAGVVGPPLFIAVFLTEGLTRPGHSAWRIAIIAGWTWISMVALQFIRATSLDSQSA